MVEETDITAFLKLASEYPVVDVRTPAEFGQGHIPGAWNIPLFTVEERKKIGITFKKKGRQHAIIEGLECAGPRLAGYIGEARKITEGNRLLIHCWRGGMRSAGMAWLFSTYGFHCHVLNEGYKAFRREALAFLDRDFHFTVIGGLTGSGKTGVLNALGSLGEQVLDLEGLAHHKGSAFGHLGEQEQDSNEQFENEIFGSIARFDLNRIIWVEDESRNIGRNTIPGGIFRNMRNAHVLFLDIPLQDRIGRLVEDYAGYPDEELIESIRKISARLGGKAASEACDAIRCGDYAITAELVLKYYDKTYSFGLDRRDPGMVSRLSVAPGTNLSALAREVLDFAGRTGLSC